MLREIFLWLSRGIPHPDIFPSSHLWPVTLRLPNLMEPEHETACEKLPRCPDRPRPPRSRISARVEGEPSHTLARSRALLRPQHQLAVLQEQRVIHPDLTAAGRHAQVAHHIPVQRGHVLTTCLWVAITKGHVDGTADLLIVEDVADAARDAEVVAEGELAQVARPVVQRELRIEELLPLRRRRLHHTPMLEGQADVLHQMAVRRAGDREADVALRRVLERAGEELPAGEVALAVAVAERAPGDGERQLRIRPDHAHALLAAQPVHVELLLPAQLAPALGRILAIEEARLVDELLELGQRHIR